MDIFSLTVGFLVGGVTGAMGSYLADKYTDKRRSQEATAAAKAIWTDLCGRFPGVIAEMKDDLSNLQFASVREFFVKSSRSTVHTDRPHLEYNTDVHADLFSAVGCLEEAGYIVDITAGNCPHYRMQMNFVALLKKN